MRSSALDRTRGIICVLYCCILERHKQDAVSAAIEYWSLGGNRFERFTVGDALQEVYMRRDVCNENKVVHHFCVRVCVFHYQSGCLGGWI